MIKQRYGELDAIRGIAALFVVLYHYTVQYGAVFGSSIQPIFRFDIGKYGVELFFIVSGFVIFLTLNKTKHASDFVVSRLSRLYPAYWVAIILTFSMLMISPLPHHDITLKDALINLSMLQKFFHTPNVDGVYWTLIIELSFYIIMYFLFVTKQLKRIDTIAVAWLFIIIVLNVIEKYYQMHFPSILRFVLMLDYGNLFIAGILFYKLMQQAHKRYYVIVLVTLLLEYYLRGAIVYHVMFFYLLFFLFVTNNLKFIATKPLLYLGMISYSLYLIHQFIGYIIIRWLETHALLTPITIIIVPLLISIAIASAMHHFIEKPSLVFIRNKWGNSDLRARLNRTKTTQTSSLS